MKTVSVLEREEMAKLAIEKGSTNNEAGELSLTWPAGMSSLWLHNDLAIGRGGKLKNDEKLVARDVKGRANPFNKASSQIGLNPISE